MAGPQVLYLGEPAGTFGMLPLPVGATVDTAAGGRVVAAMTNLSGGTVTVKRRPTKRTYSLSWPLLTEDEVDLIDGFRAGLHGDGPFCLVDPSLGNQLVYSASTLDKVDGWTPSAGTFAASSTAGPTGVRSMVAAWASATNTGKLKLAIPLPPVIAGFTHGFSLYVRTASSTANVALAIDYADADGVSDGTGVTGSTVGATTSWQKLSVSVAGSSLTKPYALPTLKSLTSTPPNILVAALGFYYDTAPATWRAGLGVPRVSVISDVAMSPRLITRRDYTLNLGEA